MKQQALQAAQRLLGLLMVVFGLNGLLHFMPVPPPATEEAMKFIVALATTKSFWWLLKGTEIVTGAALLVNRWAALAAVVLAPVTLNILLYHTTLDTSGAPLAVVLTALHVATAWRLRDSYKAVLAK